jgi:hypothetical protein
MLVFSDYFEIAIVLFFSLMGTVYVSKSFGLKIGIGISLYIWHTLFCLLIIYIVLQTGGDETQYYEDALNGITWNGKVVGFGTGTMFINWVSRFFVHVLSFNFYALFLVFNFFGSCGLVIFASTVVKLRQSATRKFDPWLWVIIFFPSLSLWTTSIGKDGLALLSLALFLRAATVKNTNIVMLASALVIMFLVRPHIALPMALSTVLFLAMRRGISVSGLIGSGLVVLLLTYFLIPYVAETLNIASVSTETVTDYLDNTSKAAFTRDDAAFWYSKSFPERFLMTAFYPTIFSFSGPLEFIVAMENMFLTSAFLISVFYGVGKGRVLKEDIHLIVYMVLVWAILAAIMYNTGLAVRQKWMFMPIILFLFLKYQGSNYERLPSQQKNAKQNDLRNAPQPSIFLR